jgi:LmbE family N-acetylglucosaminyl deacetylase
VKHKIVLAVALLFLITGAFGASLFSARPAEARRRTGAIMKFPDLKKGDRLTIIAPHPDDETIALGGLIYRARQAHIPVSVIFLTNGDADTKGSEALHPGYKLGADMVEFGKARQQEAYNALETLGVDQGSVHFLGLPDGGLDALLLPKYFRTPYMSPTTGLRNSDAYGNSYVKSLPYTGQAAQLALLKVINATHPTRIFTTMREDYHRDHWAAGQLVENIKARLNGHPTNYSFLIHYPHYASLPHSNTTWLNPPPDLVSRPWDEIALSQDEQDHQKAAVEKYQSQLLTGGESDAITNFSRPDEMVIE